jgi:hypothetical protein
MKCSKSKYVLIIVVDLRFHVPGSIRVFKVCFSGVGRLRSGFLGRVSRH